MYLMRQKKINATPFFSHTHQFHSWMPSSNFVIITHHLLSWTKFFSFVSFCSSSSVAQSETKVWKSNGRIFIPVGCITVAKKTATEWMRVRSSNNIKLVIIDVRLVCPLMTIWLKSIQSMLMMMRMISYRIVWWQFPNANSIWW